MCGLSWGFGKQHKQLRLSPEDSSASSGQTPSRPLPYLAVFVARLSRLNFDSAGQMVGCPRKGVRLQDQPELSHRLPRLRRSAGER